MKIYLASNYSTWPLMGEIAKELEANGHTVTAEWTTGKHDDLPNRECAELDLRDIDEADALILFSGNPNGSRSRGGKHVELGYAIGKGKHVLISGDRENVFHHLPQVIQRATWQDLLPVLKQLETYPDHFNDGPRK